MRLGSTLICRFVHCTSSHHRPWQIALAATAGVLLGILPKTSLLVALLGLICFIIPAHLPLLVITAILVSLATPLLESTMGRIGLWSLTHPQLSTFWMRLDSMPLVPWLGIHNTVVHGSLIAWFVASVPVYISSLVVSRSLINEGITDEVANILFSSDASPPISTIDQLLETRPLAGLRDPGVRSPIEPPIVIWDDINHDQNADDVSRTEQFYFGIDADSEFASRSEATSSDEVIRRAADTAAWAEELITDELLMDDRGGTHTHEVPHHMVDGQTASVDEEERWLIETTMEMVRIAERAVTNQAALKAKQSGDAQNLASTDSSTRESSELQTDNANQDGLVGSTNAPANVSRGAVVGEANIRYAQKPHFENQTHLENRSVRDAGDASAAHVNRPREEALHYLLRHLKGIQEKAQK